MAFIVGPVSAACCDDPCAAAREDPCDPCDDCPCDPCCPAADQQPMDFFVELDNDNSYDFTNINWYNANCWYFGQDTTAAVSIWCWFDEDDGWVAEFDEGSGSLYTVEIGEPIPDCSPGPDGLELYPDGDPSTGYYVQPTKP